MGESAAHSPVTYGLLGRTLKHSWSPQIHERLGTVPYELVELEPSELAAFVREGSWQGLNCTIPYKRDLVGLVDELRPNAKRIGAVNTLLHGPDGRVIGDNTDLFGFAWMLGRFCERHLGTRDALRGSKALVLGSGGASKAVVAALEDAGAVPVVISRHGTNTYETIRERHADAALIVNTTPVGMYPNCPASPLPDKTLEALPGMQGVVDVVYNPERTGIMLDADRLQIPAESGLAMLVGQAWLSSCMWQGVELDEALIGSIERQITLQCRNIALIGMPGSGKTSAGATSPSSPAAPSWTWTSTLPGAMARRPPRSFRTRASRPSERWSRPRSPRSPREATSSYHAAGALSQDQKTCRFSGRTPRWS